MSSLSGNFHIKLDELICILACLHGTGSRTRTCIACILFSNQMLSNYPKKAHICTIVKPLNHYRNSSTCKIKKRVKEGMSNDWRCFFIETLGTLAHFTCRVKAGEFLSRGRCYLCKCIPITMKGMCEYGVSMLKVTMLSRCSTDSRYSKIHLQKRAVPFVKA